MRIIRYPLIGLFLFVSQIVSAQLPHAYSLEELLDRALVHNFEVKSQLENREGTEAQINEVKARALPQVNLSGDYKYYIKIPAQVIPLSAFGGPEGEYATAGFGLPWNLATNLQVTQTIFSPSLNIGLKAVKLGREATELQIRRTKEDVSYNVAATYYNAQTINQQINYVEELLKSLSTNIRIAELRFENAVGQKIDVDRLKLSYSNTRNQLLTLKDNQQRLLNMLKFLSGIPQDEAIAVENTIENAAIDAAAIAAVVTRSDLQMLGLRQQQYELERRNIKASGLPTLSLYGLGNYSIYSKPSEVTKGIPAYWAGIQLNWNIFDGFARRAKIAQNKVQQLQLEHQRQALNESIKMEIANGENKVNLQLQNLTSSREQIELAEKIFSQAQLSFKEGLIDITTLIQTENSLREAQVNYLSSIVGLRTAELDLKKAAGNILGK